MDLLYITTFISRANPISVGELKAILMAQEEMIKRFKRNDNLIHANVALFHNQQSSKSRNLQDQYSRS